MNEHKSRSFSAVSVFTRWILTSGQPFFIGSTERPTWFQRWAWLLAPAPKVVSFALRTTIASIVALAIALWMELDSPIWAATTVWAVALISRGESASKARWRLIGTLTGAVGAVTLIAAFPQQPWLFYLALALWTGICTGLSSFVSNFRAYALTLSGYTCAIISMDASSNPDNVFVIAISRTTYIALGVICEAIGSIIFAANQEHQARLNVRQKLQTALATVSSAAAEILADETSSHQKARNLFSVILSLNNEIEFSEVEMGPHGHEGDHARAALAAVSALLSRCMGLATRLSTLADHLRDVPNVATQVQYFLASLGPRLENQERITVLLGELHHLMSACRHLAAPSLTSEGQSSFSERGSVDARVIYIALVDLLKDVEIAIIEYDASSHTIPGDHFHFKMSADRDGRAATRIGIRVIAAVIFSSFIYYITDWPSGTIFVSNAAMICSLYAASENPVLGSIQFARGALWAAIAAGLLSFIFVPSFDTYEIFIIPFGIIMFVAGLAKSNPSTAGAGAAGGLILPTLIAIQNHQRLDEITFFNTAIATVLAAWTAVLIFHVVLPFDANDERQRSREQMIKELRILCVLRRTPDARAWIGRNVDRFARLLRHAGPSPSPQVERYLQGSLAVLTLGLNIIRLHALLDRDHLPDAARRPIELLLNRIEATHARFDRPARIAAATVQRLRTLDAQEGDLVTRLELIRGISYLVVIHHHLIAHERFLSDRRRKP